MEKRTPEATEQKQESGRLPEIGALGRQLPSLLDEHKHWQAQLAKQQFQGMNSQAAAMLDGAPGGSRFGIDSGTGAVHAKGAASESSHNLTPGAAPDREHAEPGKQSPARESPDKAKDGAEPTKGESAKPPEVKHERSVSFVTTLTDDASKELLEESKNLPKNTTFQVDTTKALFERLASMSPGSVDNVNIMGHGDGSKGAVLMGNGDARNITAASIRALDPDLVRRAAQALTPGAHINLLACQVGKNKELCRALADALLPEGGTVTGSITNAVPFGPTAKWKGAFSEGLLRSPRNAWQSYVNGDQAADQMWGPAAPVPGSTVRGHWETYRRYPGSTGSFVSDTAPTVTQG